MFKNKRLNILLKVLITITSLLGFIFLLYARSTFISSDTAWHLKLGEWIVSNNAIPKFDTMSLLSSEYDMKFIAHEWLFDIIFHVIDKLFSLNGLIVLSCIFVLLSYVYVIYKSERYKEGIFIAIVFILVGFTKLIGVRPDTISAIIFIILGYNFLYETNKIKQYIVNILLSIFLENIHGGMVSVSILQQVWFLVSSFIVDKKIDRNKIILLVTTILSSLINPYGFEAFKYVIMADSTVTVYYSDWSPFAFSGMLQIFIIVLLYSLCIYGFVKSDERNKLDILVMSMYLIMLFKYQRTLNIFNYAFILYFSKYLSFIFDKKVVNKLFYGVVNTFSFFLILLVIFCKDLPSISVKDYITENIIGNEVLSELKDTRYFNDISLGGYLIYLDEKPFIDTRSDPYLTEYGNQDLFNPYVRSLHSVTLMNDLTSKYNLDYLLLTKNTLTSQIFYASSDWEVTCESKSTVIFKRNIYERNEKDVY